jgi:hypothetical protein
VVENSRRNKKLIHRTTQTELYRTGIGDYQETDLGERDYKSESVAGTGESVNSSRLSSMFFFILSIYRVLGKVI